MPQANCPNCNTVLKDDYGMQNCRSCGNVVLVDFDGNVKMGNEPEPVPDLGPPQVAEEQLQTPIENTAAHQSITFDLNPTPESLAPDFNSEGPALDLGPPVEVEAPVDFTAPPIEPMEPIPLEPVSFEPAQPESQTQEQASALAAPEAELNLFDMPAGAPLAGPKPVAGPTAAGFGPPGDPLGMNDFANSEASQARDGMYLFKLTIDGIDSKEIRESLREALEDTRFGWDVASVMSRIDKGRLVLDRMAPVKASVAVQRCKSLPVRMWWEQFIVTDSEANS